MPNTVGELKRIAFIGLPDLATAFAGPVDTLEFALNEPLARVFPPAMARLTRHQIAFVVGDDGTPQATTTVTNLQKTGCRLIIIDRTGSARFGSIETLPASTTLPALAEYLGVALPNGSAPVGTSAEPAPGSPPQPVPAASSPPVPPADPATDAPPWGATASPGVPTWQGPEPAPAEPQAVVPAWAAAEPQAVVPAWAAAEPQAVVPAWAAAEPQAVVPAWAAAEPQADAPANAVAAAAPAPWVAAPPSAPQPTAPWDATPAPANAVAAAPGLAAPPPVPEWAQPQPPETASPSQRWADASAPWSSAPQDRPTQPAMPAWASQPTTAPPPSAAPSTLQVDGAPWQAAPVEPEPAYPNAPTAARHAPAGPTGIVSRQTHRPAPPPRHTLTTYADRPGTREVGAPGKTLAIVAGKGGVGKSTVSLWVTQAIGAALREQNRTVGLIDANIGQGDIGTLLGLSGQGPDLAHLAHGRPVNEVELDTTLVEVDWLNAYCLFGPHQPMSITAAAGITALSSALRLMRRRFSWTIIDSPVGTSHDPVIRDFVVPEADLLLVVVAPDQPTVFDTRRFLREISAPTIQGGMAYAPDKVAIVLNLANPQTGITLANIREELGEWRVLGEIPDAGHVQKDRNRGVVDVPPEAAAIIAEIVSVVTDVHVTSAPRFGKRGEKFSGGDSGRRKRGRLRRRG